MASTGNSRAGMRIQQPAGSQGARMGYKKLSPEEISITIGKIRSKYDFYCTHFHKLSRLKDEFESRYRNALKAGTDVSNFLLAEIDAITELIKKEEEKIAGATGEQEKKKPGIADKVIEKHNKMIEKYPEVRFHRDADEEIVKLLGTLNYMYEELLPSLHGMFRPIASNPNVRDFGNIETRLRTFAYTGKGNIPGQLSRYFALLNRFPRDYRTIGWEEKEYIRESAFLLHDLSETLDRVYESLPESGEANKKQLADIRTYVKGVLADFRLKDLKRKD
jgi:hypothetical protein